jgi:integrase
MSVRARGNQFQADFSYKGQRYRQDFATKAEAETWEHDTKSNLLRGLVVDPNTAREIHCRTMRELFDAVFTRHWSGTRNEEHSEINGNCVVRVLGEQRPINSVNEQAIDGLVAELRKQGNAGGTINRKLSALSKMLKHAHRRGWLVRMPHIERCKESEHRIRWLTQDEETKLLAWCDFSGRESFKDLVIVLVDSGMRLSEALNMPWTDTQDDWLRVWGTGSKNGKSRSIPQTERVKEVLTRRRQLHADYERVFQDLDKWSAEYGWRKAREYLKLEADDQFVLHCLRHTFCSRLVQLGVPLLTVKELAGHTAIETTMRYAHLAPQNLVDAIKVMQGLDPKLQPKKETA